METEELIRQLASKTRPVPRYSAGTRLAFGLGAGLVGAFVLLSAWLGLRPDLIQALGSFALWMKALYAIAIAAIAIPATAHLARPDARAASWFWLLGAPILGMAGLALWQLTHTPASQRLALWLGDSARECPFRVIALSIPIYAGLVWAFRRLAPTRLGLVGAAAGMASGALGAAVYVLHCPEIAPMFVATWYSLGILGSTLIGALLGRVLLRW